MTNAVGREPGDGDVAVSVIIPVHNASPYLRQCLDSVTRQTLASIEVICIDDGSTDDSPAILRAYADSDNRVRVVTQTNQGYGQTMNRGLAMAVGEYVGIVESDDWIEPTMFKDLLGRARLADADMAKANFYRNWAQPPARESVFEVFTLAEDGLVVTPRDYRRGTLLRKKPSVWSAIYRREFLLDNGIRFLETPGAAFQDTSFSFKTLALAERMVCLTRPYVHYRQDNGSSSINSTQLACCVCQEYAEIQLFLESTPSARPLRRLLAPMMYDTYIWNYNRLADDLKLAFLEAASRDFRRLLVEGLVEWEAFGRSDHKRTNFRMIAYDPGTYHHWRQMDKPTPANGVRRVIAAAKRAAKAIIPPSRSGFAHKMQLLSRQLEAQERMLEHLERQIAAS